MKRDTLSYHGYRFPPDIISHAVWLYHRFGVSFRDVEDLLAQRGITVSYEAIRLWCLTMALLRNSRSRRTGPRSSSASVHALRSWHSKLRHPVQHSALDRGFDFLVLDRAGREAYPEYRLVP